MPFRNIYIVGQGRAAYVRSYRRDIYHIMRDIQPVTLRGGVPEFFLMTLSIVERDRLDSALRFGRKMEKGRAVHPTRYNTERFNH